MATRQSPRRTKDVGVSVYDFLDHRAYLAAYYQAAKRTRPSFSFRLFSKLAGLRSPNFLKLVIDGERNLGADSVGRFAQALGLEGADAEFFADLVAFSQAQTLADKNRAFERIAASRRFRAARRIDGELFAYLSHWYNPVIRELAAREDFPSAESGTAGAAGAPDATSAQDLPQAAIQDAAVVLGELRFQPCDAGLGTEYIAPGPFVVDLKRHSTVPKIPEIAGTPGGYCGLDAPLAPARSPAALAGQSVFFDGTRADGTFFIVYANMKGTLRLRATPGASWQGMTEPPKFFWALRPRRWLAQSELNAADVVPLANHPRAIVIDADRHPGLFLAIRARLAGLSTLYADADGNGVFTDSDRAAIVGEGLDNAD